MSRYLDKQLLRESRRGHVDRVEELLAKGAALNKLGPDGFTPLMHAAFQGHRDTVATLLQHGADPNQTAKDGASALFWACVHGHAPVAELLIAAGADVNAARDGEYSVLNAAISNSASVPLVQTLISAGASLDHRWSGKDIPQFAESCGRQDLVQLLKHLATRGTKRSV